MTIDYQPANINVKFDLNSLKYPFSVYLKVTNRCILNCKFCSQDIKNQDMDFDFALKQLNYFKQIGVVYIFYTGGEPLLYEHLKELLEYGYQLGFKQILVTNGLCFSNKKNFELLNYLISLGCSLHGKESVHDYISNKSGCFKEVVHNLKAIREFDENIKIDINYTTERENINYENLKFVADFCKDNNFNLYIARLNYVGKGKNYNQDVNEILSILNKITQEGYKINLSNCIAPCVLRSQYKYLTHGCGAGWSSCAVETNGDVKVCATSTYVLGNLYTKRFKKIWNNSKMKDFRSLSWLPPQCRVCEDVYKCKGACRSEHNEKFWQEMSDKLVIEKFNDIWNSIKDKKINLAINNLRIDYNYYIIVAFPARKCNEKAKFILSSIDGSRTASDLVNTIKNERERVEVKNFLIALKIDNLIY